MSSGTRGPRPEPRYKSGEVRLSHNSIGFLLGLVARPDGRAASIKEWIEFALPFVQRFRPGATWWTLYHSHGCVWHEWVTRKKAGSRITVTLTPRGRAIADRTVPSRVVGRGPFIGLPDAPPPPDPFYLRYLRPEPARARPASLPRLDVPGFDLDWRPDEYPRDRTEIARFTVPRGCNWVISYQALRVGRSWRLRAESFPFADPTLRIHRRTARAPLSLGDVIALVDRTEAIGLRHMHLAGLTFIDGLLDRWMQTAKLDADTMRVALRVESAIYPQLESYFAARLQRWSEHLAAGPVKETNRSPATS